MQAGLIGFLTSAILFYLLAIYFGGRPSTVSDFFHDASVRRNAFSLTAANLGLGTGLVYVLFGTETFGLLFVLLPLALFFGQAFYSYLVTHLTPEPLFNRGTLLSGLHDELDVAAGKRVYFQQVTTSFIIITYVLALSYEILVSAEWLASTFTPHPSVAVQAVITFTLLVTVVFYTITGGFKTVQRTDFAQALCAIILLIVASCLLISRARTTAPSSSPLAPLAPTDAKTLLGFCTLALTPFSAQIYGILNNSMASHQPTPEQRKRLFRSRFLTLALYMLLSFSALYYNYTAGGATKAVQGWITAAAVSGDTLHAIYIALVAVGLGAIVMSTADTLLIGTTQVAFENYFHGNSRDQRQSATLARIRTAMLLSFPFVFAALALAWKTKPDVFTCLFAFASPCEVAAPLIICLIILAKKRKLKAIVEEWHGISFLRVFYALMVATLAAATIALAKQWPWTRSIGFMACLVSVALTVVVLARSNASASPER